MPLFFKRDDSQKTLCFAIAENVESIDSGSVLTFSTANRANPSLSEMLLNRDKLKGHVYSGLVEYVKEKSQLFNNGDDVQGEAEWLERPLAQSESLDIIHRKISSVNKFLNTKKAATGSAHNEPMKMLEDIFFVEKEVSSSAVSLDVHDDLCKALAELKKECHSNGNMYVEGIAYVLSYAVDTEQKTDKMIQTLLDTLCLDALYKKPGCKLFSGHNDKGLICINLQNPEGGLGDSLESLCVPSFSEGVFKEFISPKARYLRYSSNDLPLSGKAKEVIVKVLDVRDEVVGQVSHTFNGTIQLLSGVGQFLCLAVSEELLFCVDACLKKNKKSDEQGVRTTIDNALKKFMTYCDALPPSVYQKIQPLIQSLSMVLAGWCDARNQTGLGGSDTLVFVK